MRILALKYGWICVLMLSFQELRAQVRIEPPNISDTGMLNVVPPADSLQSKEPEPSTPFRIREIYISGNKKTKFFTIERELPFKRGDKVMLKYLVEKFEIARQQLMNTALFHEVVVAVKSFSGYDVDILVDVKERWYIFPIPYFKLIDRNLNQWWVEQNKSLERVNYGLKFTHYNFTGRKDKLRLWLISGYNRQIQMRYEQPYADKSLKHGYNIGFSYLRNRELNFNTIGDKQAFVKKEDGFLRDQLQVNLEYVYRPALRTRHTFRLIYTDETVGDTIVQLNPGYFNDGMRRIRFPELSYTMDYQFVDYIPYPQQGLMADLTFSKQGFNKDLDVWALSGRINFSRKFAPKMSYTLQANASIKVPFDQPFYTRRFMGFGDNYLRGLEYYVVDGVAGGLLRTTLRREILNFKVNNPLKTNLKQIPFRFFLKTYADIGYVYSKTPGQNELTNRPLYTAGIGLDVVTIYDFVLRLEFSFNQLGEKGFFLHNSNDF